MPKKNFFPYRNDHSNALFASRFEKLNTLHKNDFRYESWDGQTSLCRFQIRTK